MAKPHLQEFLDNRNFIALKISSSEVSGFFQKKFTVPLNTTGLALFPDGTVARMGEGRDVVGKFDLLLVKDGDVLLRFPFENLRSNDGFPVAATMDLHVRIQTQRDDLLKDFARAFFNFPGHYTVNDLKTSLGPEMRQLLSDFTASQKATDLHKRHRGPDIEQLAHEQLERHFFATGLSLVRFGEMQFASPEFATRAAAEAKRDEEDRRRNEKMDRKESKMRRIATFLQDATMKELLDKIPDERAKGLLYAKLMEDDSMSLNPRDLAGKIATGPSDLSDLIFKAMEGLLSTTGSMEAVDVRAETVRRIYIALGNKVLEIDPAAADAKPREFTFKDPLRSVRAVEIDGVPLLMAGCKRTVHLVTLDGKLDCQEFPLPGDSRPKGGVNSVAASGDSLFATHSEYGLIRWDRSKPGVTGDLVHPKLTAARKTTRGATILDGRILFASGNTVHSAPLVDGPTVAYETGFGSPITTLATGGGMIYAGTEGGSIVAWKLDAPAKPEIVVRRTEAIANLRLAKICSIPHLLYSAKDMSVRARVIGQTLETSYESSGSGVGVLDAGSDLICATDGPGRRLFLWKAASPARPYSEIELHKYSDKPVLDMGMRKTVVAAEEPARA